MKSPYRFLPAALAAALLSGVVSAAPVVIDIDTYVTGQDGGAVSVAKLTLTQNGANVDFKIENTISNHSGASASSFLSLLQFSYDGTPALTGASFTGFGGTQVVASGDFGINPSGQDAGYDFYLDLDYPTSDQADRFVNAEVSTWTVLGVNVSDFTVPVSGSGPASLAMVHIQGLANGDSSKYVGDGEGGGGPPTGTVPEPTSLALIGVAMLAAGAARRRR